MNLLERRAHWIYEVCRLEAIASKRPIVPEHFNFRDDAFRNQFFKTIDRICTDGYETTPEKEHESWLRAYEKMGWCHGPTRDPIAKTHPDMLPFNDLPEAERIKDEIFLAVCDLARRYIKE